MAVPYINNELISRAKGHARDLLRSSGVGGQPGINPNAPFSGQETGMPPAPPGGMGGGPVPAGASTPPPAPPKPAEAISMAQLSSIPDYIGRFFVDMGRKFIGIPEAAGIPMAPPGGEMGPGGPSHGYTVAEDGKPEVVTAPGYYFPTAPGEVIPHPDNAPAPEKDRGLLSGFRGVSDALTPRRQFGGEVGYSGSITPSFASPSFPSMPRSSFSVEGMQGGGPVYPCTGVPAAPLFLMRQEGGGVNPFWSTGGVDPTIRYTRRPSPGPMGYYDTHLERFDPLERNRQFDINRYGMPERIAGPGGGPFIVPPRPTAPSSASDVWDVQPNPHRRYRGRPSPNVPTSSIYPYEEMFSERQFGGEVGPSIPMYPAQEGRDVLPLSRESMTPPYQVEAIYGGGGQGQRAIYDWNPESGRMERNITPETLASQYPTAAAYTAAETPLKHIEGQYRVRAAEVRKPLPHAPTEQEILAGMKGSPEQREKLIAGKKTVKESSSKGASFKSGYTTPEGIPLAFQPSTGKHFILSEETGELEPYAGAVQLPGRPPAKKKTVSDILGGGQAAPPELPNPKEHEGDIATDHTTGLKWISDGKQWMPYKG